MIFYTCRFSTFRRALDAEMREATKLGITQETKMAPRQDVTVEEETKLWELQLLGDNSAESLVNTLYFYNGKLFGLRSNEHRMLRVCNFKVLNNLIIFDESVSKTFHGGLKDLKKEPRFIKHECHKVGEFHIPCLQSMYSLYLDKVKDIARIVEAFYLRPKRDRSMGYEKSAIGLCSLNKILPDKLCAKAGLPRKTSHCLRITCATALFQNGVEEKIIRERTGHTSNALLKYQLSSKTQTAKASAVLGPSVYVQGKKEGMGKVVQGDSNFPSFVCNFASNFGKEILDNVQDNVLPCSSSNFQDNTSLSQSTNFEFDVLDDVLSNLSLPCSTLSNVDVSDDALAKINLPCSSNFEFDVSDDVLANLSLPTSTSIVKNVASNAVFNNCSINFHLK